MKNIFYIVNTSDNWWKLKVKDNYGTLSTGDSKERVLDYLKSIVTKYTEEEIIQFGNKSSLYMNMDKEYELKKEKEKAIELYEDLINDTIKKALKEYKRRLNHIFPIHEPKEYKVLREASFKKAKQVNNDGNSLFDKEAVKRMSKIKVHLGNRKINK